MVATYEARRMALDPDVLLTEVARIADSSDFGDERFVRLEDRLLVR